MGYELTHDEYAVTKPMLPQTPRGMPRVNDRRVLKPMCLPSGCSRPPYIPWFLRDCCGIRGLWTPQCASSIANTWPASAGPWEESCA